MNNNMFKIGDVIIYCGETSIVSHVNLRDKIMDIEDELSGDTLFNIPFEDCIKNKYFTKGGIVPCGTFIPDINIVHTLNKTQKQNLINLNLLKTNSKG